MAQEEMKSFYKSRLWQKQREYILRRDHYICTELNCNNVATEVHHIVELTPQNINDMNITLNELNLRSLCHDCHTRITKQMKSNQRTENVLPLITFTADGYPVLR